MISPTIHPDTKAPLTAPLWAALREGRIVSQRCGACGYIRWEPAPLCPECAVGGGEWVEVEGLGSLWTFTVYHRALHPAFRDQLPYAVGLVELGCGVRMIGRIAVPGSRLTIGMRLRAEFQDQGDGVTLIEWVAE